MISDTSFSQIRSIVDHARESKTPDLRVYILIRNIFEYIDTWIDGMSPIFMMALDAEESEKQKKNIEKPRRRSV